MSILSKLKTMKNLSPSELDLSEYIIKHPAKIIEMNIRELATRTYTSTSTVVRFSKKVCEGGFPQMKIQIALEMNTFSDNPLKITSLTSPLETMQTTSNNLKDFMCSSLSDTVLLLDFNMLEQIVLALDEYDFIDIYGIGSSYLVGSDFHYKLTRVGKNAHIEQGQDMHLIRARNSSENRLSFLISYSGETPSIIEIAKTLIRVGSPIISITGSQDCTLQQYSTHSLYVSSREPMMCVGNIASRTCMNYVLDLIFLSYYNKNYVDCLIQTERTYIHKN